MADSGYWILDIGWRKPDSGKGFFHCGLRNKGEYLIYKIHFYSKLIVESSKGNSLLSAMSYVL